MGGVRERSESVSLLDNGICLRGRLPAAEILGGGRLLATPSVSLVSLMLSVYDDGLCLRGRPPALEVPGGGRLLATPSVSLMLSVYDDGLCLRGRLLADEVCGGGGGGARRLLATAPLSLWMILGEGLGLGLGGCGGGGAVGSCSINGGVGALGGSALE